MPESARVLDTGLRPALQNVALSRALLEARGAAEIPDTLRFLRHAPAALLDCGQSAVQEFDLEACRTAGFGLQRRVTRGVAVAVDEGDLGWELCLHRDRLDTDPETAARRLCNAAAAALQALGVAAHWRAHHEIAVEGRRLVVTAMAVDGPAVLFEGCVRVIADPASCQLLRLPALPETNRLAAVRERTASLATLLGRAPPLPQLRALLTEAFESELGVEFTEGDLTLSEQGRYQRALAEMSTEGWVQFATAVLERTPQGIGTVRHATGVLRVAVIHDLDSRKLKHAWLLDDVPVRSRAAGFDLEAALAGVALDRIERVVERYWAEQPRAFTGLQPADLVAALRAATQSLLIAR